MVLKKRLPIITKSRSYSYLTPMLAKEAIDIKSMLRNTYIGDEDYPEFTNNIFLLYEFSGHVSFQRFEREVECSRYFVKSYDPDKYTVMKVFSVPEQYQEDYNMFMDSKYSKFSEKYKREILQFHKNLDTTLISDVLYKKEAAYKRLEEQLNCQIPRELEASSKWDSEHEVYNDSMKIVDTEIEGTINGDK